MAKGVPGNQHNLKHGKSYDKVYYAWIGMKQRCNPKNKDEYPRYAGRGIRVCDEWANSFEKFYEELGDPLSPDHSIDRIDNNKKL